MARRLILIDTGAIFALADLDDAWHERMVKALEKLTGCQFVIPCLVISEAAYLLNKYLGSKAETAFVQSMVNREMTVDHLISSDYKRCLEILSEYTKENIGMVDASVLATAERLGIQEVLTTDRRHFSVLKPRHVKKLTLIP